MKRPNDDLQTLTRSPRFQNGEIHQWYRFVLGYPDHLVAALLDRLPQDTSTRVLDPFCGSGTTLVECMKRGIRSVGIDANPAGVFASTVKTNWSLKPARVLGHAETSVTRAKRAYSAGRRYQSDQTFKYLTASGMLKRGWISPKPLRKTLALKRGIALSNASPRYKSLLNLCLLSEVVYGASNVKFGPEIYCGPSKKDHDVFAGFETRVRQASDDLTLVSSLHVRAPGILQGDSRECDKVLKRYQPFSACICSPPYPTEHDYTRNTRLELAFMETVFDRESLRTIKKQMIRSHTKGIYKGDQDRLYAIKYEGIRKLVATIRQAVKGSTIGFVELYPDVIAQYFGGMARHFTRLRHVLAPGAMCAYVVGDQSSYRGIHVPTAELLGTIVDSLGFVDIEIVHWRGRWSSTRSKEVDENILVFRRPATPVSSCQR